MIRAVVLVALLYVPGLAYADYALPAEQERLVLLVERWELEGKELRAWGADDTEFRWAIDTFWLADRICSDLICTGGDDEFTQAHLAKLKAATRNVRMCVKKGERNAMVLREVPAALRVELVRIDGRDEFFVAGIWVAEDDATTYERAQKAGGSALLRIDSEAMAELDEASFAQRLKELSDAGWRRVREG
jgi:hypothetical protein